MREIIHLVTETKDKNQLLYSITCYFTCLIRMGYSREYLYMMTKKYFFNKDRQISDRAQIEEYFKLFSCHHEKFSFLILMDVDSIEYMDTSIFTCGIKMPHKTLVKNCTVERYSFASYIEVKGGTPMGKQKTVYI